MNYLNLISTAATFTVVMGMDDLDTQISEVSFEKACAAADADNYCTNHVDVWTSIYYMGQECDHVLNDGLCVGFVANGTPMPYEYKLDSDGSKYDDYPEAMSAHVEEYNAHTYMIAYMRAEFADDAEQAQAEYELEREEEAKQDDAHTYMIAYMRAEFADDAEQAQAEYELEREEEAKQDDALSTLDELKAEVTSRLSNGDTNIGSLMMRINQIEARYDY